jgi:hypothetical protein
MLNPDFLYVIYRDSKKVSLIPPETVKTPKFPVTRLARSLESFHRNPSHIPFKHPIVMAISSP